MKYSVNHTTTYMYSESVSVCHNEAYLTPRNFRNQSCQDHRLLITPIPSSTVRRLDYFGNEVSCFSFNVGYVELKVKSLSHVTLDPLQPPESTVSPSWDEIVRTRQFDRSPEGLDAYEFAFVSPRIALSASLRNYAVPSFGPGRPVVEALAELTSRIHNDFQFDPTATTVTTPVDEVFERRRGVCQDFAHLQIAMLRSLGLPARYVSGYLLTTPPPGESGLIGADASHAWLSVYCGEFGWIDVDPTNNVFPNTQHITVAWGRDFSDVPPIKGVYTGGGDHTINVEVDVTPVNDQPGTG